MSISMASFLRSSPPSLLPLPPFRTQPSLLHPLSTQSTLIPCRVVGGLVARPNAVTLPSLSLPSRPTRRTLVASSDDGPVETATAAVNNLKEWWDSLFQQPSDLPMSTAWWKKTTRKWLDAFETTFCLFPVALLFRMGYNVLAALIVCGLMKLYLNIEADHRLVETQDMIDRIADRVRLLLIDYEQDKQRSEAMEKSCLDGNNLSMGEKSCLDGNNIREPTRRTLGPILAASLDEDDDLPETMTTVNKLKEWWDSLTQQPP